MSSVQMESLWQFIDSLSLSQRNRQWLADKLVSGKQQEKPSAPNAETIAAINEARNGAVTQFTSFEQFKKHMYDL